MNFEATTRLLAGFLFLAFVSPGRAIASTAGEDGNPYKIIGERNVFHLNPIPPPPAIEAPKAELPNIKLSGFIKIGKSTHVLFTSVPKDKKKEPTYYDLADGQKDGILQVVNIREEKGEVDILNSGTPATLTLKSDSLEATEAPPTKGNMAKSRLFSEPAFSHAAPQTPGKAAYRFSGAGQGTAHDFSMPMRRTRLNQ